MPKVFKKPTIDAVYRMSRSDTPENPASTQGTNIVLYDDAFNPKYVLTEVLEHELAHQVFLDLPRRVQDSFRDAAGWRNDEGGTLRHRPESQFLRKNGMLSPDEDFADSLGAFFHKPTKLKKTSPQVYNWMKAHFK